MAVYLFRIDGSRDNDAFFDALRAAASLVYAGVDLRIGEHGWIPDLVRVEMSHASGELVITLVELEATASVALISCRKYLPENSGQILKVFADYLDRVIKLCRSTADSRLSELAKLREALQSTSNVLVTTAGALRSATEFVEELRLLDQPQSGALRALATTTEPVPPREFRGTLRLGAEDASCLTRCILVLDALVRKMDHSTAIFRAWRGQTRSQPPKRTLADNPQKFPAVRSFILRDTAYRGLTLDIEPVLTELIELWQSSGNRDFDRGHAVAFLSSYFPVARNHSGEHPMSQVFDVARQHLPS